MAQKSSTMEASEYDMIHQACPDGYETIEEVNERDDILFPTLPPRHGPLPSPGYSGLMLDAPKPPGVYSRMDYQENSVGESNDGNDPQSDMDGSNPDHSDLPEILESSVKIASPGNSYLVLKPEIYNAVEDITKEIEEKPLSNLTVTQDFLQSSINNDIQDASRDHMIPSSYLTTREIDSTAIQK